MADPETDAPGISVRAAEVATEISETDQPAERRRLVSTFTKAAVSGARAAGRGTRAVQRRAGDGTGWLADHVMAMAPRLRVRDAAALRRAYTVLQSGDGETSFLEAAVRTTRDVDGLRRDVAVLSAGLDDARADLADAIRHVAVVRYDAFGDMGGRLSFSAALLDDSGDGLVLSSIAGRTETRTYAKGVKSGNSEAQLSPEEEQVVGWALRRRSGSPKANAS